MVTRNTARSSVPAHALPAFTPVPRKCPRHDGWTPERQKAFLEALADTGCVSIACRMVNMSTPSYYHLRRQPGAESFRAAAEAAQALGLQVVKDEAFERALHGQLVPVFVGGKLMGFRRKKNDRLLMFILRHYGQDAAGRKTTINYFSTRATAGAATLNPPRNGEGDHPKDGGGVAASEASTTTVKTVISGPAAGTDPLAADTDAANLLNAFEGVELDEAAQAEIYRALTACAERRRALADDPDNDPACDFVHVAPGAPRYLGALESGVEGDWIEYRPEGEHVWENLGDGGYAAEIDAVVAGMKARRAAMTSEERAAEAEAEAERAEAEAEEMRALQCLPVKEEPDPDDPGLDWRNWGENGYIPPAEAPVPCTGGDREADLPEPAASPQSRLSSPRARKRAYKKRRPKPPFVPPDEVRKAQAVAEVEADRRVAAAAEAMRRKTRGQVRARTK
ncbi:MAG TPA: hypothetical protein VMG08_04620 [Allosphingosinicella sp.]|nr:hypothetical protein [Allosphingosinicella sp.]